MSTLTFWPYLVLSQERYMQKSLKPGSKLSPDNKIASLLFKQKGLGLALGFGFGRVGVSARVRLGCGLERIRLGSLMLGWSLTFRLTLGLGLGFGVNHRIRVNPKLNSKKADWEGSCLKGLGASDAVQSMKKPTHKPVFGEPYNKLPQVRTPQIGTEWRGKKLNKNKTRPTR